MDDNDNSLEFIPTRSSMLNPKLKGSFKGVVYTSHKRKSQNKTHVSNNKKLVTSSDNNAGFNIKQAKYEVIKFGMSGFDPVKKEEAKVQLAVRLGAKPHKNKYKNYKELLDEKKKEKARLKSKVDFQQLGKNQMGKATAKGKGFDRKRRKQKSDLLDDYGKVKGKVQYVKKK